MAEPLGLCFAAAGSLIKWLGVSSFTLVWTHSVQHTRWEEDWLLSRAGLQIVAARVEGHGAGMEPPEGAQLKSGRWHWSLTRPPQATLQLRRSDAVADWQICQADRCQSLAAVVPAEADLVSLSVCTTE